MAGNIKRVKPAPNTEQMKHVNEYVAKMLEPESERSKSLKTLMQISDEVKRKHGDVYHARTHQRAAAPVNDLIAALHHVRNAKRHGKDPDVYLVGLIDEHCEGMRSRRR
ncbi:hypothetical protein NHJ76_004545 [Salmonella enterica]|nr:hypothetical protein [Salmonella enterica]EJJ0427145.1 hypothetical protein [Salmonella enterica]